VATRARAAVSREKGVLKIGEGNGKNYEKRKGEKRESLIF